MARNNYAGTQVTQWDFQNKGNCNSPARLSFVLEVPLSNLRPSIIYSVPCDRIVQRAYLKGGPSSTPHLKGTFSKKLHCPHFYENPDYSILLKTESLDNAIREFSLA